MVVGPYMSNFELFYYLITNLTTTLLIVTSMRYYLYFTAVRYCLLFITATSLRRLRYAATRAPLSRSLRGGPGRLGTRPGRTKQSK